MRPPELSPTAWAWLEGVAGLIKSPWAGWLRSETLCQTTPSCRFSGGGIDRGVLRRERIKP